MSTITFNNDHTRSSVGSYLHRECGFMSLLEPLTVSVNVSIADEPIGKL